MKSYIKIFKNEQEKHPELGSYIILCSIIRGSKLERIDIRKLFNKLVPKDEYDTSEKFELIDYLFYQSHKTLIK